MARAVSVATRPSGTTSATPAAAKKIAMHIPEIPAFGANRKPFVTATSTSTGPLPITESAKMDITGLTSPTPSASASQTAEAAPKLNPRASAFVFKPTAAAFKPGQASVGSGSSPAMRAPSFSVNLDIVDSIRKKADIVGCWTFCPEECVLW